MAVSAPLSYSAISTYLDCPLRYKFLYVDGLAETPRGYFSFGRTIHEVLEALVRPLLTPVDRRTRVGESQKTLDEWHPSHSVAGATGLMSRPALLEFYEKSWVSAGYRSAEEESRYRRLGADLLSAYYDVLVRSPPVPVAIEEHLEATWEGIPVHGYIDRIDLTSSGGLDVIDYKTSRELSRTDAEDSDQLSLYQVLVEANYTRPVESLTLYHLRSLTPHRVGARTEKSLEPLRDRVEQVHDGIGSASYDPTPGRICQRCEFQSICPEFRPVPAEERARLEELVDRFAELRSREATVGVELRRTADELHREAERLGVHRMPGRSGTAVRRKETRYVVDADAVRLALKDHGVELPPELDAEELRRMASEPQADPALKAEVLARTARQVRWFWEIESAEPND